MMHINKSRIALIASALLSTLLLLPTTHAATAVQVFDSSTMQQEMPGLSVLGYEFVGEFDMMVTAIGIFDLGGDGISSPHTVAIWDDSGNVITQQLFPAGGGDLLDGFRYIEITPLDLMADIKYTIGVFFFANNTDEVLVANSSNEYSLDPRITILGGRSRIGSLGAPDMDTSEVFIGPNFQFTAVPVPAAVWLMAGALGVLGGLGRRKQHH